MKEVVVLDKHIDFLSGKNHIHFIGIGGSGMFPIAQILHDKGFFITGSDNNPSDTLELVKKLSIPVFMAHKPSNIDGADVIIYTAAIMPDNEELIAAKNSNALLLERSVMLGALTKQYENSICICGTHGKTTTSSMITQILLDSNFDPTVVIGGKLSSIGGNGRVGHSNLMVCEACEFVDTFLKLHPNTSVILNIDEDHMDYFKTMDNLIASFNKFLTLTTGLIVANGDDKNVSKALYGIDNEIITFGMSNSNDCYPININYHPNMHTSFEVIYKKENIGKFNIFVPGTHNILNALASIASTISCGVSVNQIKHGFENFRGAGRRFELLGKESGITVADDYAHHPEEIKVTLEAAKNMSFNRVIAVHQPFTYSRTKLHLDAFSKVLSIADKVILSEIMGSRETNTIGIYSKDLAAKIDNCVCFESFEDIANHVVSIAQEGDLIITMGCGDIYKVAKIILEKLKKI